MTGDRQDAVDTIVVPAALDGERLDRAIALVTGWPRVAVQALVDAGAIRVDGQAAAKSHRLRTGEVVDLLDEPRPDAPPTGDASVEVIVRHADDDVIVVAKPAGLVMHPGAGHAQGTLVEGLIARYPVLERRWR